MINEKARAYALDPSFWGLTLCLRLARNLFLTQGLSLSQHGRSVVLGLVDVGNQVASLEAHVKLEMGDVVGEVLWCALATGGSRKVLSCHRI